MPKELYGCEGDCGFVGPRVVLYVVEWTDCIGQQADIVHVTSKLKE